MCVSWQVPFNKRKNLGDEVGKKRVVQALSIVDWYTTDTNTRQMAQRYIANAEPMLSWLTVGRPVDR